MADHWLFCWNPKNFTWDTLADDAAKVLCGETLRLRWSCQNRKVVEGDTAWMLRLGVAPKGIFARGTVVSEPYEAEHYDADRAAQGNTTWYVDLHLSEINLPDIECTISQRELEGITVDSQNWSPQSSGIELKSRSAAVMDKLWSEKTSISQPKQESQSTGVPVTMATNLILYGPPGTGKTYHLIQLMERYSSTGPQPELLWLTEQISGLQWYATLVLALADMGGSAKVPQLVNHKFIKAKAQLQGRLDGKIQQTLWNTLSSRTSPDSVTVKQQDRREPYFFDKDENSTWHLQPNWKSDLPDLEDLLTRLQAGPIGSNQNNHYEIVTFHQSYGYEDFVEGIRPVSDSDNSELGFQVKPGIFRMICDRAAQDPDHRYALFIDEINRANIAKVLGELITLLEPDKRAVYDGNGNLQSGLELKLPYSQDKFGVPANLDIYGTMNTADRSISLIDTALRRRFQFKELMPDTALIKGSRGDGFIEDGSGGLINLRELLDTVNKRISALLNREMTLGHAYLINCEHFSDLKLVIEDKWMPLLQEYFYDDWQRIRLVFADTTATPSNQIVLKDSIDGSLLFPGSDDLQQVYEAYKVNPSITPDGIRKIYSVQ